MTTKTGKNIRRFYTVKDIWVVFVVVIVLVVLFDTTGLKTWADRMNVESRTRPFFESIVTPLDTFMSGIKLNVPRNGLRDAFFAVVGKKREAGFLLADSGGEIPDNFTLSTGDPEDIGSWMNSPNVGWNREDVETTETVTSGTFSSENPLKVLLIGDSMMGDGFGTMIERVIEDDPAMTSHRYPRHSSGLSRPDYYNWPAQVTEIFANGQYDAVVVILGTNDAQSFEVDSTVYERFDEGWSRIYASRLKSFLNLLSSRTQRIYWVGMPPMRETGYNGRMQNLNEFFEEGCESNPEATYVSTVEILGDVNGNFTTYLEINGSRITARNTDGIHLTRAGGELVAHKVMELMKEDFNFMPDPVDVVE